MRKLLTVLEKPGEHLSMSLFRTCRTHLACQWDGDQLITTWLELRLGFKQEEGCVQVKVWNYQRSTEV